MFLDFFDAILVAAGSVPLAYVDPGVAFWLKAFGVDRLIGGFVSGISASVFVIGVRTLANLFTLGAARL